MAQGMEKTEKVENTMKEQAACGCHAEADCACCEHEHDHGGNGKIDWKSLAPLLLSAVLLAAGAFLPETPKNICRIIAFLAAGIEVLIEAGKGLIKGHFFGEEMLMSIATIGALCLGDYAEAAAVMLFYRVGEGLQDMAVARSRQRITEAVELHPDKACRYENGVQTVVSPEEIQVGETILVKVGERVPLDGDVVEGESLLDVSMLTGEPKPVLTKVGTAVSAGSVNTTSQLILRVTRPAEESATSRLLRAVEDASANKPGLERFITRFSKIYTPCMMGAALLVAVVPPLLGYGPWSPWIHRALIFLVISCPCALVLSIPLTFFAGLAICSKASVLMKGADSLEVLPNVKAVVMDKTGTLTKGEFTVQSIHSVAMAQEELLALAAALEKNSLHPIAAAIAVGDTKGYSAAQVTEIAGHGIRGTVNGHDVAVGNRAMMELVHAVPEEGREGCVYVAVDGAYAGSIQVGDQVRPSAKDAVRELNELAGKTVMLTGDDPGTAERIGKELGVMEIHGGLQPGDKLDLLKGIRQEAGSVMFIGDGINDAPVLAGADVGVAMGVSGTEMAAEAADVLLLTEDLTRLPYAVRVAKRTVKTARGNIAIALGIKLAALILGMLGIANMWIAVVADVGAACICVLHTLLLFRSHEKASHPAE